MQSLGVELAARLKAGDLILLNGSLGAGKTSLVQGIGKGLGIEEITSPTFVIARTYQGVIPLIHVDAYRLVGEAFAIFDELDLESQMGGAITIIEWGDGFVERLSDEYLEIQLSFGDEESDRILSAIGHGLRWAGFEL